MFKPRINPKKFQRITSCFSPNFLFYYLTYLKPNAEFSFDSLDKRTYKEVLSQTHTIKLHDILSVVSKFTSVFFVHIRKLKSL